MAERRAPIDIKSQPGFRGLAYFCVAFLYIPMILLVIFAFNSGDLLNHFEGLSTKWFWVALANGEFYSAAANTMTIAVFAAIFSTIVAAIAAIGTTRVKPWRGIRSAFMVINLPLMVPEIVTAVSTLSFFSLLAGRIGINFGIGNLILAHTVFCIPFAYMPIRARLEGMDLTLDNAAADLYASPWNAFRRITLPLLAPGIMSGTALAFITSFDDFTITQLVAGPGQTTLPVYIWSRTKRPMSPEVSAMATILLVVSVLFVVAAYFVARRRKASVQ